MLTRVLLVGIKYTIFERKIRISSYFGHRVVAVQRISRSVIMVEGCSQGNVSRLKTCCSVSGILEPSVHVVTRRRTAVAVVRLCCSHSITSSICLTAACCSGGKNGCFLDFRDIYRGCMCRICHFNGSYQILHIHPVYYIFIK